MKEIRVVTSYNGGEDSDTDYYMVADQEDIEDLRGELNDALERIKQLEQILSIAFPELQQ